MIQRARAIISGPLPAECIQPILFYALLLFNLSLVLFHEIVNSGQTRNHDSKLEVNEAASKVRDKKKKKI